MTLKKSSIYNIFIQSLALLVFIPGRLAHALVILFAYNFFIFTSVLIRKLIKVLNLEELQIVIVASVLTASAVFIKGILNFYCPLLSLSLNFSLFMACTCIFFVSKVYTKEFAGLKNEFKENYILSLWFSLYAIMFALFRDVFGYGTISLPVPSGIFEITVYSESKNSIAVFFASIPGALSLLTLSIAVYSFFYVKFNNLKRVEA